MPVLLRPLSGATWEQPSAKRGPPPDSAFLAEDCGLLDLRQGLIKVGDNIVDMLDPYRYPDQFWTHPCGSLLFSG